MFPRQAMYTITSKNNIGNRDSYISCSDRHKLKISYGPEDLNQGNDIQILIV